jgi:hypothetical protein
MKDYTVTIQLLSDTTFGRGEGLAGSVDTEIEHDQYGCPVIGGRTLKGLLREEWTTIAETLDRNNQEWHPIADFLFGDTVSEQPAKLHIGAATLPPNLLQHVQKQVQDKDLTATDVLASLTTVRRQTAVNATTDVPKVGSLRSERALIRTTWLAAPLTFEEEPTDRHLALLAACVLAVRRGGLGRNRGRGRLELRLHTQYPPANYEDETFTRARFANFVQLVNKEPA